MRVGKLHHRARQLSGSEASGSLPELRQKICANQFGCERSAFAEVGDGIRFATHLPEKNSALKIMIGVVETQSDRLTEIGQRAVVITTHFVVHAARPIDICEILSAVRTGIDRSAASSGFAARCGAFGRIFTHLGRGC